MPDISLQIAENVAVVRGRIAAAAARSGRAAADITLVAVTKYVSADWVRPLIAAGCNDLGESRPQQLWEKAAALADLPIRWHLVGHLQRNKVHRTLPLVALVHSVDSARLAAAMEAELAENPDDKPRTASQAVLLEVNASGEAAKHGLTPEGVEPLLVELANYRHVAIRGLMCMASLKGGLEAARRDFAALRELRDRLRRNCPPSVSLDDLSMGMSGDFEVAIEEGATIVRIGTALFETVGGMR